MRVVFSAILLLPSLVAGAEGLQPRPESPVSHDGYAAANLAWAQGSSAAIMVQPGARPRRLAEKLADFKVADDYIQAGDDGDFAPAIERAAADGVRALGLVDGRVYTLKRTVNLPNGSISIRGIGPKAAELRLAGAATTWFSVGNSTSMSYNFFLENILFTKEQSSTTGSVIEAKNLYIWGLNNSRVYGENKIWSVIRCLSCGEATSRDVRVDNIRAQAVYATCGAAPPGKLEGQCFDLIFDNWYTYGTNSADTISSRDGVFVFEDNFQAIRIINSTIGKHYGYAYRFNGTIVNRGNNILNFVINPNVESSHRSTGVAYFGAVASSQIGGSVSWVSGWGGAEGVAFPAIHMSADSLNITVRGLQLGVAKSGAQGIFDEGTENQIQDIEFVGYDGCADVALTIGSMATKGYYRRLKASQLKRVIADKSADTAGLSLRDVAYARISDVPLSGLVGSPIGNKDIGGILNLDAGAPILVAASVLDIPDKGESFVVNGTAVISRITPTYLGRRVTLLLTSAGTILDDLRFPIGAGALYLSSGSVVTNGGRWRVTLEWRGDYWWEVARVSP